MPTLSFLDSLWQDIRFGARMLRKNPGFTAIAVLTLALGIGASTAVFSLIDAVLLRVAPYKDSQQLVFIFTPVPKLLPAIEAMVAVNGSSTNFQAYEIFNPSGGDFNDMRTQSHSFSEIAMFGTEEVNLATGGNASRVHRTEVTGDFFSLFRVSPEIGRAITPEDARPGAEAVAVISHNLWESRFGADRNIIGKIVQINTKPYRIVGITPRSFQFPFDGDLDATTSRQSPTDIWISSEMTAAGSDRLRRRWRQCSGATAARSICRSGTSGDRGDFGAQRGEARSDDARRRSDGHAVCRNDQPINEAPDVSVARGGLVGSANRM